MLDDIQRYIIQRPHYFRHSPHHIALKLNLSLAFVEKRLKELGYIKKYTVIEPSGTMLEEHWESPEDIPEIIQDSNDNKFYKENTEIIAIYIEKR